jgi:FemAB-related protein (PEP-CTERM system-associated)
MTLPLAKTTEMAWNGLDRKVRNQVRKAEHSGLTVHAGGVELVDDFYRVFAHNMRDLGTPVHAKRFFEIILLYLADRAACVVVQKNGKPVAAAVTLTWRNAIEVPWAASLKRYRSLSANTLLYWTVMQRAIGAGLTTLDFGRSSPGTGTYRFKEQWGATPHPLCWEYALAPGRSLPNLAPANPKFSLAIAAWKWLPVSVATFVGPRIVQSIP